jgi:2-oxoglutarate ferredoxin oxidoreductase subunit gamma
MNQPSYDKFIDEVAPGGVVVADSDLIEGVAPREGIEVYALPATSLAEEAGLKGLSNIVLLGALWAHAQFCERETLDAAIDKSVPPSKAALIDKNKQALQIGINA